MCKDINALLLIDDSARYAIDCAKNGIPTILFGDYAWNNHLQDALSNDNHYLNGANVHASSQSTANATSLISRAADWHIAVETILSSISPHHLRGDDYSSYSVLSTAVDHQGSVTFQSKLRYSFTAYYSTVSTRSDKLSISSDDISIQTAKQDVFVDSKGEATSSSSVEIESSVEILSSKSNYMTARL